MVSLTSIYPLVKTRGLGRAADDADKSFGMVLRQLPRSPQKSISKTTEQGLLAHRREWQQQTRILLSSNSQALCLDLT